MKLHEKTTGQSVGARHVVPGNHFLILLTAFLWISCSSMSDIAAIALGGDVGATTIDTSTVSTTSDSTTISSTGTDTTDSTDASDDSSDSSSAGDNSATSDGVGVSDSGDITLETSDSIDSITDDIDTSIESDSSNSPVVFVPLPEEDSGTTTTVAALTLSPSSVISAADSDSEAVMQADADSFEASSTISITNASYVQRHPVGANLVFARLTHYLPGFVGTFLDRANTRFAPTIDSILRWGESRIHPSATFIPTAFADSGACIADSEGEVIATINADGSLDPTPIPDYNTGDVLAIAYCDPATGTLGTADNDSALPHVVYLGDAPSSSAKVTSAGGELFLVDDSGNFLEMNYDATDDRFTMDASVGGFDEGYSQADAGTPDELDRDEENDNFIFRESGVVSAVRLSSGSFSSCGGGGGCDSITICSATAGCSANNVKVKSGKVYYATEWSSAQSTGTLNELYDNTANKIDFSNSSTYYTNATTGSSERGIQLTAIKAFDVVVDEDAGHWSEYLTVFEDGSGNLRLFGQGYSFDDVATMSTVSFTLSDVTTVRDLIIYHAADHAGSAALLYDRRLQLFTYDLNEVTCEEEDTDCTAATANITRSYVTTFTDDENPVALAVNEAGTLAFVLNQGSDTATTDDDYVTVVDLTSGGRYGGLGSTLDPDGNHLLDLSTFLGDKVLTDFSPTAIHSFTVGDDGYLFVGADHFNIGIVMGPF